MTESIFPADDLEDDLQEHHRCVIAKGQQALRIDKFLMNSIENKQ